MNKLKNFFTSVPGIILVFVLAAFPLIYGGVGSARAALTYKSETYVTQVQLKDIGISLIENGENISKRDYANKTIETADGTWNEKTGVLLYNMLPLNSETNTREKLIFNHPYQEELTVMNTGSIPEYVRVTIYKYWVDEHGEKTNVLSPALIDLSLTNLDSNWILDEKSSTPERIVLYYKNILASGETAPIFSTFITINGDLKGNVKTVEANGEKITTYDFSGYQFRLEATADGVQTHNPEPAMLSAWGRNVTINNGVITSVK